MTMSNHEVKAEEGSSHGTYQSSEKATKVNNNIIIKWDSGSYLNIH